MGLSSASRRLLRGQNVTKGVKGNRLVAAPMMLDEQGRVIPETKYPPSPVPGVSPEDLVRRYEIEQALGGLYKGIEGIDTLLGTKWEQKKPQSVFGPYNVNKGGTQGTPTSKSPYSSKGKINPTKTTSSKDYSAKKGGSIGGGMFNAPGFGDTGSSYGGGGGQEKLETIVKKKKK